MKNSNLNNSANSKNVRGSSQNVNNRKIIQKIRASINIS